MSQACECIDLLLDPHSFIALGALPFEESPSSKSPPSQENILTGQGKIKGRKVSVFVYKTRSDAKRSPEQDSKKITRLIDLALKTGTPLIGIYDSQDQDKQEEIKSLTTIGEIFSRQVMASGVIPQIAIVMGSCSEELACSVALNDFVIMVENHSQIFLSSPERIKAVTHEEIDAETLGGSKVHQTESGVSLLKAPDENAALSMARDLFSFLPANNREEAPLQKAQEEVSLIDESLDTFIPKSLHQAYDMKGFIQKTLDESFFFEIGPS
ncbi:MAG: methylmalonyl-CoA carboxyltransferase, partial [Deltaproteobacteria bacterium]|nr:methylmalonyl-CoA carboxyltransferase [Deltaproteobacteria bacterium]